MLTEQQESFLAAFADAGLAEQQETVERNAAIDLATAVAPHREAKEAELQQQAQALIDEGLAKFDEAVAKDGVDGAIAEVSLETKG